MEEGCGMVMNIKIVLGGMLCRQKERKIEVDRDKEMTTHIWK